MDTTTKTKSTRRVTDPEPFIQPATMERAAIAGLDGFWVHSPRTVWPQKGGRMVRRDYLRAGDHALSSHYGLRKVESVSQGGTDGQTTTIIWESPVDVLLPFSESYDSSSMIELLTDEQVRASEQLPITVVARADGLFYLFDRVAGDWYSLDWTTEKWTTSSPTMISGFTTYEGAAELRDHLLASGHGA